MKKHAKVGNRKGQPAYRTPSRIRNKKRKMAIASHRKGNSGLEKGRKK